MRTSRHKAHRRRLLAVLCLMAVVASVAALSVLTSSEDQPHVGLRPPSERDRGAVLGRSERSPPVKPKRLFARGSFWNAPLADDAVLDPSSGRLMAAFRREIEREQRLRIGPWIATEPGSTPYYRVRARQRRVAVRLVTGPWGAELKRQLAMGVPLPANAQPARGPDRHLTVYQPSSDTLWDLYHASRDRSGWRAEWGGIIRNVSKSPGHYTNPHPNWGATATSLPVIGGTVTLDELRRGEIGHALALNVPNARRRVFSWPAQRTDGIGGPDLLPEGARLRLDPQVDVGALRLPPVGRMLAEAAQRYGVVVRDKTHHATGFSAENSARLPRNPYRGPKGFFRGTPATALAGFPWDRLQLLKMDLCVEAPCERRTSP